MSNLRDLIQPFISINLPPPTKPPPLPSKPPKRKRPSQHDYSIESYLSNTLVPQTFTLESHLSSYFRFSDLSRHMKPPKHYTSTLAKEIISKNATGRQTHERFIELEAQYNSNEIDDADVQELETLRAGVERERTRWKQINSEYACEHLWVLKYISIEALRLTCTLFQHQLKQINQLLRLDPKNIKSTTVKHQWQSMTKLNLSNTSFSSSGSTSTASFSSSSSSSSMSSNQVIMQRNQQQHQMLSTSFPKCINLKTTLIENVKLETSISISDSTSASPTSPTSTHSLLQLSSLPIKSIQSYSIITTPYILSQMSIMKSRTCALPITVKQGVIYIESPLRVTAWRTPKEHTQLYYQHLLQQQNISQSSLIHEDEKDKKNEKDGELFENKTNQTNQTNTKTDYIIEGWSLGNVQVGVVTGPYALHENIPVVSIVHPQYYPNVGIERMMPSDATFTWMTTKFLPLECQISNATTKQPAVLNINIASIPETYQHVTDTIAVDKGEEQNGKMNADEQNTTESKNGIIEKGKILKTTIVRNVNQLRREHVEEIDMVQQMKNAIQVLHELCGLQLQDGEYLLKSNTLHDTSIELFHKNIVVDVLNNEEEDTTPTAPTAPTAGSNDPGLIHALKAHLLSEECDCSCLKPSSIVWTKEHENVPQVYNTFPPKLLQGRFLPHNGNKGNNGTGKFQGRGLQKKRNAKRKKR